MVNIQRIVVIGIGIIILVTTIYNITMISFKMINQTISYAETLQKQTFQFIQLIYIDVNMNIASQYQQIQRTQYVLYGML